MARTMFTFTDLFAGVGGFRVGLERAGGRCVYSVERDRFCRRVYGEWFGREPEGADIADVDPAGIPAHHVMAAGFPCQPFSRSGVSMRNSLGRPSGLDCDDGNLFFRLASALEASRPAAFVFENVKNLMSHDGGNTWGVIRRTLDGLGYAVRAKVLDAADFGLPQRRERAFIVGFDARRIPRPRFLFPRPTGGARLRDILEPDTDPSLVLSDRLWRWLRDHSAKHKAAGHNFGYSLADPDGATRTLSARYFKDGSEILVPRPGGNPRRLSRREAARLMGFPDSLPIDIVSRTQTYRQLGNAVAPPVAEAVGRQIMYFLNAAGALRA